MKIGFEFSYQSAVPEGKAAVLSSRYDGMKIW